MATTYELIASNTVGSGGASSVTFSSIPQTFTDLKVVASIRSNNASTLDVLLLQLNGSTVNDNSLLLWGNGSSALTSGPRTGDGGLYAGQFNGANSTANTFSNTEFYIPNYTSSNYKSVSVDLVWEQNASAAYDGLNALMWANTAAVTSIKLIPSTSSTIQQYSTFYLYGIKNS